MPRNKRKVDVVPSPEEQMVAKLLGIFQQAWSINSKDTGMDPLLYSRLSLVALTQFSAITAVDIGMQPEQFLAVCKANFENAYAQAPRFG